jgi:hypothetical protein
MRRVPKESVGENGTGERKLPFHSGGVGGYEFLLHMQRGGFVLSLENNHFVVTLQDGSTASGSREVERVGTRGLLDINAG